MQPRPISPEELAQILSDKFRKRFWEHIKITEPNDCWHWTLSLDSGGYGHVGCQGKLYKSHRIAWILTNNCDVPEGKDILHSCVASRTCCNPAHLRTGTDLENRRDTINQGRLVLGDVKGTKHGMHKLTDEQVVKIRELYATGAYRQKDIAAQFGICREMVSYIVRRKNWTHL